MLTHESLPYGVNDFTSYVVLLIAENVALDYCKQIAEQQKYYWPDTTLVARWRTKPLTKLL